MSEIVTVRAQIDWLDFVDVMPGLIPGIIEQKLRQAGFRIKEPSRRRLFVPETDLERRIEGPLWTRDLAHGREFVQMYEVFR